MIRVKKKAELTIRVPMDQRQKVLKVVTEQGWNIIVTGPAPVFSDKAQFDTRTFYVRAEKEMNETDSEARMYWDVQNELEDSIE